MILVLDPETRRRLEEAGKDLAALAASQRPAIEQLEEALADAAEGMAKQADALAERIAALRAREAGHV